MLDGDVRLTMQDVGAQALAGAVPPRPSVSLEAARAADDEEEPDVKRGPGALRDIQRLLWLARLDHGGAHSGARRDVVATVPPIVADARHFLWQVRCHLHLLAGHAQDRMVRELQPLVARRLDLGRGPNTGVAELMDRHLAYTRSVRALLTAA